QRRVHVPAAAAEEPRREPPLTQPRRLRPHARDRVVPCAWTRLAGAAEVRVVPDRPPRSGLACPLDPALLVFAGGEIRRAHQRRDPEPAGPALLELGEEPPRAVVERMVDVAGDDCVGAGHGRTVWRVCGICGLVAPTGAGDPALVDRMNAALVHRGPDDGSVDAFGRCVLGHRRLRVVDLVTGGQPVRNEAGDVVAVFNGELY